MDAAEALILIVAIHQQAHPLSASARTFLNELAADLGAGRTVELTQEDLWTLRTLCRRVGVPWTAAPPPDPL